MSDDDQPEVGAASIENQSGGVNVDAQQVNIGGDVVGRDKIVQTIINEAPAPVATSLHQLPPPPRDFTGRAAELAELMMKAETDGVTISGLQGMGGVGKTTLALVLAERLKPRYPEAQFYLDLKGADKQPLSVVAALTHVIRAYHPTAQLPASDTELRGLYMSVLEAQRALLLMDNAVDRAQVEPLIPPSSCFLLVTSRQHFSLPGLFATDLNTLPPNEAHDLLLKIAPRINGQADAIAKLCGCLPLALRLAGSALSERRTLTPENYVQRLEDAQTRLELVEASLSLSYNLLTHDLQRAWCALSVFPDSFDLAAATAVWEIEEDLAQDRLDELVRYSLVEWIDTDARARLHDLTRLFANKRLSDASQTDNQRRYASHYKNVSATANNLYLQGGKRLMQGLGLFDLEWTNIQAGHAWAAQYADTDAEALSLCDKYPAQCSKILLLRQHPRERINWLETALTAARKLAQKSAESTHLSNLGTAYFYLGNYRRAVEYHEQALAIDREIGAASRNEVERTAAWQGVSQALSNLGVVYKNLGEYRRAIEYHEQALAIDREISDRRAEGEALGNLGNVYSRIGEYRRALGYHEQALAICREVSDRRAESQSLGNLGVVYEHLGEHRRAVEYHEQALTIDREIKDRQGEGQVLGNMGFAYYNLNDFNRAFECFMQQRAIAQEIGDKRGEAKYFIGMALCFDATNDRLQAITHAQEALEIYTALESPYAQEARDLLSKWRE